MGLNASILKKADFQTKNFMINGYNGVWTFDHDGKELDPLFTRNPHV